MRVEHHFKRQLLRLNFRFLSNRERVEFASGLNIIRRGQVLYYNSMWYVYVLESEDGSWHYYGYTSNLKQRFDDHSRGKVASTKKYLPLKLRYYEAYDSEKLAKQRESTLKSSRSATKALLNRINEGV